MLRSIGIQSRVVVGFATGGRSHRVILGHDRCRPCVGGGVVPGVGLDAVRTHADTVERRDLRVLRRRPVFRAGLRAARAPAARTALAGRHRVAARRVRRGSAAGDGRAGRPASRHDRDRRRCLTHQREDGAPPRRHRRRARAPARAAGTSPPAAGPAAAGRGRTTKLILATYEVFTERAAGLGLGRDSGRDAERVPHEGAGDRVPVERASRPTDQAGVGGGLLPSRAGRGARPRGRRRRGHRDPGDPAIRRTDGVVRRPLPRPLDLRTIRLGDRLAADWPVAVGPRRRGGPGRTARGLPRTGGPSSRRRSRCRRWRRRTPSARRGGRRSPHRRAGRS